MNGLSFFWRELSMIAGSFFERPRILLWLRPRRLRPRFTRDLGPIVRDEADLEIERFDSRGEGFKDEDDIGADRIRINVIGAGLVTVAFVMAVGLSPGMIASPATMGFGCVIGPVLGATFLWILFRTHLKSIDEFQPPVIGSAVGDRLFLPPIFMEDF